MITKADFEAGSTQVTIEVRIYRDAWTVADKAIVRHWTFSNAASITVPAVAAMVQSEITAFQDLKAKAQEMSALIGVEQTI
jgi:hypothetical protein